LAKKFFVPQTERCGLCAFSSTGAARLTLLAYMTLVSAVKVESEKLSISVVDGGASDLNGFGHGLVSVELRLTGSATLFEGDVVEELLASGFHVEAGLVEPGMRA
jgi:phosphoribosylaminoimidazole (AIR) synthetase